MITGVKIINFNKDILSIRGILPGKKIAEEITDNDLCQLFDRVTSRLFPEDLIRRKQLNELIHDRKIAIGTSILTNINSSQSLNACTVMNTDLKQADQKVKSEIKKMSLAGMGLGFSLNSMPDPKAEVYRLNKILQSVDKTCRRPVAGITNVDISHPKIMDYIQAKKEVDFSNFKLNISVSVDNDFMNAITHKTATQEQYAVFDSIAESMLYCGEPGLLFMDQIEKANPVPDIKFESFSPCAELAMGKGEACQFSYINLSQMLTKDAAGNKIVNLEMIASSSRLLTRALDESVQISIDKSLFDNHVLKAKRRIGIGVCGYADMLIELGIIYGSDQGNKLLQDVLTIINYASKEESMQLAIEKGAFSAFSTSQYVTDKNFLMRFSKQGSIDQQQWMELNKAVLKNGLRNSSTIALPPTGNSSLFVGASNSIEPHFSLMSRFSNNPIQSAVTHINENRYLAPEERILLLNALKEPTANDLISKQSDFYSKLLRTATAITPEEHLSVVVAGQPCIDDAISKTINLQNSATRDEISQLLKSAYSGGVKGISVFRESCLSERQSYVKGDVLAGNKNIHTSLLKQ
jgi:ribonucleoside-diphosphate reductase alpha chain